VKRPVEISEPAQEDILRLANFLAFVSPDLPRRARSLLETAIESLGEMPERGRRSPSRPNFRELVAPFGSAAYLIQYRVDPERVIVFRIQHSREDR
jgi:plasmid stabilization system protein ParE